MPRSSVSKSVPTRAGIDSSFLHRTAGRNLGRWLSFDASHERRSTRRILRFEGCEERAMMAVDLSGTKFNDLTGNGFSQDDTPLGGVTIQLFQDDGDGVFNPAVDPLFDSTQTAAGTGAYTFSAVPDGRFFLREIAPANSTQTGGPAFYDLQIVNGQAFSGTHLVVDNFNLPDPASSYVINLFNPDPTLIKNSVTGVLGGERDVLIDVLGVSGATTIFGSVGLAAQGGTFVFGSSFPAVQATLQYDGSDVDVVGPPASLINSLGLSTDLTGGGANTGFRFDFNQVQVPGGPTSMDVQIRLTSTGGGTAIFNGNIPESPVDPSTFFAPFSSFATGGAFTFAGVTSIEVVFNAAGVADIDFVLDGITVDRPQARLFDFANFFDNAGAAQVNIDKVTIDGGASGDGLTILANESITWQYTITNPGTISLFNLSVTDDQPGVTPTFVDGDTNGNGRLDPGESWIYTAAGTSIRGTYNNLGTVVATPFDTGQGPVTDTDPSNYIGVEPLISIDKVTVDSPASGDGLTILVGETISWRYTVTNTGDVPLSNVSVVDSRPGVTPTRISGDTNGDNILDLTETWIYEAQGTAVAGNYDNIGTASGDFTDDADHTRTATDTDPSNYIGVTPQINIDKVTVDGASAADGLTILSGESIIWRYTVTNTGTVPLSNVTVTDNQAGVTPTRISGDTNGNNILDLTETWIYEANGTAITGAYNNIGTANGGFTDTAGHTRIATDTDPSNYVGVNPQISIDKVTVDGGNIGDDINVIAGSPISWTYTVTNTGTVPLANVVVTDNQAGVTPTFVSGDTNGNNLLDLTETWIFSANGTAIVGNYSNIGTASGGFTDTAGHTRTVTDTDPSNYFGTQPVSSISGYVYVDVNNDGFFSPVETPLQNVTITLTSTDNGPLVTATTVTNIDGFYIFSNLRPGTYKIVETQPVQFIDGKDTIGTPGGTTTNDMFSNIVLPADFDGVENNFGEYGLAEPSKQYLVYPAIHPTDRFDVNGDGQVNGTDVLQVVNTVNANGSGHTAAAAAHLDVNQDGRIDATDVLQLVNRVNYTAGAATHSASQSAGNTASAQAAPSMSAQAASDIAAGLAADEAVAQLTGSSAASASAGTQPIAAAAGNFVVPTQNQASVLMSGDLHNELLWGEASADSDDLFNLI